MGTKSMVLNRAKINIDGDNNMASINIYLDNATVNVQFLDDHDEVRSKRT